MADNLRLRVVLDLAELLSTSNLDNEVACHSSSAQPDCGPLFAKLGLSLDFQQPSAPSMPTP